MRASLPAEPASQGKQPEQRGERLLPKAVAAPPSRAAPPPPAARATKFGPLDGNEATARVAYAVSDVAFIYPITPATPMGELVDQWASDKRKNIYNNLMSVRARGGAPAGITPRAYGSCRAQACLPASTRPTHTPEWQLA